MPPTSAPEIMTYTSPYRCFCCYYYYYCYMFLLVVVVVLFAIMSVLLVLQFLRLPLPALPFKTERQWCSPFREGVRSTMREN